LCGKSVEPLVAKSETEGLMKKLLLAAAAGCSLLMMGQSALADGYGPRGGLKDYARCANFGGFYLGGNVGWGYYDHTWNDRDAWAKNEVDLALPSSVSSTTDGFVGGVQAGYNMQRGCTVFGIETDYSWANLKNSTFNTDGQPGAALDRLTVRSELNSFGTIRTRAGVVVDNVLLYTTGGVAYAQFRGSWTTQNILAGGVLTETFAVSDTRWGWVAGVGTEWAVWKNVSIKSEALYMKFEDQHSAGNSPQAVLNGNPAHKRFDEQDSAWVARIGVNYRFGCGTAC
jgi:outer membrane immunogenic protein